MTRFAIILTLPILVFFYLGFRLTGLGWGSWVVSAACVTVLFLYPMVWRGLFNEKVGAKIRKIAHFDMGFVSFLMALLFIRDLLYWPLERFAPDSLETLYCTNGTLALIGLAIMMFGYGSWNAWRGAQVVRVTVPIANLAPELETFTIAQISDLHIGTDIDEKYVRKVVDRIETLEPSVVVMTGDIADGAFAKYKSASLPLADIARSRPLVYVVGNHEYYWGAEAWIGQFRELGAQTLLNTNWSMPFSGKSILFAGTLDPAVKMIDPTAAPDIARSLKGAKPADLKVLLSHHPGVARPAVKFGFDLQLSGHTHSGQFFPWNLVIGFVHEFSRGLKKCESMWVYVNPGTGWWGPPLRLGTTPEITLLSFKKA